MTELSNMRNVVVESDRNLANDLQELIAAAINVNLMVPASVSNELNAATNRLEKAIQAFDVNPRQRLD